MILNGNEEDLKVMKVRMEKRKQELKKNKMKKVKVEDTGSDLSESKDKAVETNTVSSLIQYNVCIYSLCFC